MQELAESLGRAVLGHQAHVAETLLDVRILERGANFGVQLQNDFASWGGVFAPAGTPRAVVMKLNAVIGAALEAPDVTKRFNDMGLVPKHSTPEALGQFLQAEMKRWRALMAKKPG